GLIAAQAVYVYHFLVELLHLVEAAFGSQTALQALVSSIGYKDTEITALNETIIMLVVLALIDVVMISNLLIMVIVGGYETFVSRMELEGHPDQPEWLSHVNASVLKVKLATAIIGISSIHLLKTFINAANYTETVMMWQTLIHITFLLSAIAIAYADKLLHAGSQDGEAH
ncbi:MAG: TIGR00645 family protein, partial [Hylemonella sp.]